MSRNGVYRILRDDYYTGLVTYRGVKREGTPQGDHRPRDGSNVSLGAIGYHFGTTDNLLHEALAEADAPDLRSAMAADFDALGAAITTGIEQLQSAQPKSRRLDPEVSATLVMAVFDGLIMQGRLDPSRLPAGEEIAEMLRRAALQYPAPAGRRPRKSASTVGA